MKNKSAPVGSLLVFVLIGLVGKQSIAKDEYTREALISITLSPTHSIDLVEFEPGVSGIIEHRNADQDRQLIDYDNGRSLTSAFRALRPNEPIPESLRIADERAASKVDTLENPTDLPSGTGTELPLEPHDIALRGYWTDWTSDAQWFLQNFCNTGQNKWCPINVNGWAYSGAKYDTTWFQSTGFAQGFNSTAHFWVQYRSCSGWGPWYSCSWKTPSANGNFTLQPRHLVTITWTSSGSRWAGIDQSSDRVGLAVLWNTNGSTPIPSPTPNPGPCNDLYEFCCPGTWTASFYCNGSLICSGGLCRTP